MQKSINQINAIIKTSDMWELYRQIDAAEYSRQEYPAHLKKWFRYNRYTRGEGRTHTNRWLNCVWYEMYRDLPATKYGSVTMLNGEEAHVRLSVTSEGVKLYVSYYSSVNVCVNVRRSNQTFDNFDFQAYYDKHVEKLIFFADGFFQNLQIVKGYTKKQVVEYYRDYLKFRRPQEKLTKREYLVQKLLNLNIDASYCYEATDKQLFAIWQENKGKKRATMTYVERPNLWELSQEYDNDEDIMEAAEEYLYHSDNKIFI